LQRHFALPHRVRSSVTLPGRQIRHDLPQALSIVVLATLRGATSLFAIGELARDLPKEALSRLGSRVSPTTGTRVVAEESTIRRMLKAIDADAIDQVVNAWIAAQVASGRLGEEEAVEVDFGAMVEDDEHEEDGDDAARSGFHRAIALDGKTLRGARLENGAVPSAV